MFDWKTKIYTSKGSLTEYAGFSVYTETDTTWTYADEKTVSDKARATFNENLPSVTVNVRKDCVDKKHQPSAISHLLDRHLQRTVQQSSLPRMEGWTGRIVELR